MPDVPATGLAEPSTGAGTADLDSTPEIAASTVRALDATIGTAAPWPGTQVDTSRGGQTTAPPCAACLGAGDRPPLHDAVPLATQFLSRELIPAIVDDDADPALDPRWAESGARDRAEYAYWAPRTCGIACLQMVLGHYGLPVPPLVTLARQALAAGCYEPRPDGGLDGLLYHPFVDFVAARFGLRAQAEAELDLSRLTELTGTGALVIVSVNSAIRHPEQDPPQRGGHLVLVTGIDGDQLHLRDPAGHNPTARAAVLDWPEFEPFSAGRGVAVWAPLTS